MSEPVTIQSTDYWIKVVEMLQQNWALIEAVKPEGVCVYFISDTSGVFDQMSFADEIAAREALVRNRRGHPQQSRNRRLICYPQSEDCTLPHRGRKYGVVHHSILAHPTSATGQTERGGQISFFWRS
jgi:hypothetical protein